MNVDNINVDNIIIVGINTAHRISIEHSIYIAYITFNY